VEKCLRLECVSLNSKTLYGICQTILKTILDGHFSGSCGLFAMGVRQTDSELAGGSQLTTCEPLG